MTTNLMVMKEPSKGLKKAIEDDQNHKMKLVAKYEGVHKLYNDLPANYKRDLKQVFAGIEEMFDARKNEIKRSECTILVVGETASGKSSLINLLLGQSLMPTSALGCTATVVEIRTTRDPNKREAVGYYRSQYDNNQKRKSPPIVFDLRSDRGIQQFQAAVADSDEDGYSPYDRIEVTWPFGMLEEGLVIVDTPGIGSGGKMSHYVEKYLAKSYGFIYVVNSANAGGVQKGRYGIMYKMLQNFLRMVVNAAGEEGYSSESTMFVCNRWDMVPDKDRDAVKHDTFDKLNKYFPDLHRSQVHYMSITEAQKAVSLRTSTSEYTTMLDMVEKLLPDSLRSRLNTHYKWLTAVLKRMIYILKVSKVMAAKSMEKNKEEFQQIKVQIERLEQNSKDSINYLKTNIASESDIVARKVVEVLQSRAMAERLFDWRPEELPKEDKKKVAGDALEKIANKIAYEMNIWERDNNIIGGIKEKIIRVCKRDFELMENQIAKIEGALLDGDSRIVKDLHKSIRNPAPVKQVWSKAKVKSMDEDSSTYKGLGGMVASVGTIKAGDKAMKKIFSDYKLKNIPKCVQLMQDAMKAFLDSIFQSKNLQEKVLKFFNRFVKDIDAVAKMIPDFLKADLELMEILKSELSDTQNNLRELFPMLLHESHVLLGQCDSFYVNFIMRFDYDLSDLIWDSRGTPVGSGSFADVYIASIKTPKQGTIPVALKVCRDPLKENTVTDILLEDRTLRELDHPNVVRYYGATYRFRNPNLQKEMQWIMIMEVCKYTMKQKFVDPQRSNPGKCVACSPSQVDNMVAMADVALQLCRGVDYLHQKGFVHRDLKLENILVTEKNIVKLTDVGLTKQATDIAQSLVGSPVYMAPEVLLQPSLKTSTKTKVNLHVLSKVILNSASKVVYKCVSPVCILVNLLFSVKQSQNYNHKADVYSLGIIFWEMWYGQDAADYIQQQLFTTLEKAIKDGLRPSLKLSTKPPEPWIELIERSWAYNPEDRPSVSTHIKFFEGFIHDSRRM
ncbi:STY46-like protein [Mya arenaria]|uniref:STY46-like protein n=1 Tax=Mya arenaria TaxID=6604 RepID=A0ABY7FWN4_MYAAR|nr:STY46-like protein [Mya arenaria]